MSDVERTKKMSVEDYLKLEESANRKNEYVRGQIFAMSGAAEAHNVICSNIHAFLHTSLRGTGCRAFMADMKVRVESADSFYYPDIMVTCEPYDGKSVFKSAPTLIVEVLSASTRQIDRREKLVAYRQLDSLWHYVLVHQQRALIEHYKRISQDQWEIQTLQKTDELRLDGIAEKTLCLPVSTIYEDVVLPFIVKEEEEEYECSIF